MSRSLTDYAGVFDVDSGAQKGKPQLSLTLEPKAALLGLTATDLARQVRSAFYGAEALRQQEGRNEVKVRVRLPKNERASEHDVESLLIRTPSWWRNSGGRGGRNRAGPGLAHHFALGWSAGHPCHGRRA